MTSQPVAPRPDQRGGALLAVLAGGLALRAVFFLQIRHRPARLQAGDRRQFPLQPLGLDYQEAGRDGEAIRAYRESVALRPGDAVTQNNLGVVLARSGHVQEAIPHLEEALPGFPDAPNLARALALVGRQREAQEVLRQAEARAARP